MLTSVTFGVYKDEGQEKSATSIVFYLIKLFYMRLQVNNSNTDTHVYCKWMEISHYWSGNLQKSKIRSMG